MPVEADTTLDAADVSAARSAAAQPAKGRPPAKVHVETLKTMFDRPQPEAAKELGISLTTLKQVCRRLGMHRSLPASLQAEPLAGHGPELGGFVKLGDGGTRAHGLYLGSSASGSWRSGTPAWRQHSWHQQKYRHRHPRPVAAKDWRRSYARAKWGPGPAHQPRSLVPFVPRAVNAATRARPGLSSRARHTHWLAR